MDALATVPLPLPLLDGADVVAAAALEDVSFDEVAATAAEVAGGVGADGPLGEDWFCSAEIRVCMKLPSACSGFELDAMVDVLPVELADDVPDMPD